VVRLASHEFNAAIINGSQFVVIEVSRMSVVAIFFRVARVPPDGQNRVAIVGLVQGPANGVERCDAFSTESRRRATPRQ